MECFLNNDNPNWLACIKEAETDAPSLDIYTAASLGDTEVVEEVVERNPAWALHRNGQGWSPLMFAVWQGHDRLVAQLLHAAGLTGQDAMQPGVGRLPRSGRTLLMVAARFGHLSVVQTLCNRDTLEARDFQGQTALLHAIRGASEGVVRYLIGQGVNVNTIDNEGHTALWFAEHCKLRSLENLLREAGAVRDVSRFASTQSLSPSSHLAAYQTHIEDFAQFLTGLSLGKYLPLFEKYGIDFETFLLLSEDDLKRIGITLLGPRRKMALEIRRLRALYGMTDGQS